MRKTKQETGSSASLIIAAWIVYPMFLNSSSAGIFMSEMAVTRKTNEPCCEKTGFLHMRKKRHRSAFGVTAKLISAFVFAIQRVQSLYFLNPKFQASNYLLWLDSPVCVRPGRKPRRPVFSQRGSYLLVKTCMVFYDTFPV